ncbi:MAG: hypothetical protein GY862_02520 [Gammaproteobacteria bacterium]|nr:hypothetical protein [Gammaproteobacteria bacterium]
MPEHAVLLKENERQLVQEFLRLIRKYGQKPMQRILKQMGKEQEQQVSKEQNEDNDPWSNPDIEIPSGNSGIGDLAINHDHYLYGTPKKHPL